MTNRENILAFLEVHGTKVFQPILERCEPTSSAAFIARLYTDIDILIAEMEQDADVLQSNGEVALTRGLMRQLRRLSYVATAETVVRGHADLVVEVPGTGTSWVAESKIHQDLGYEYLQEGLRQLVDRYATARLPHLGLLLFVKTVGLEPILQEWRRRIAQDKLVNSASTSDDPTSRCFRSTHVHSSGATVEVRHMGVHLHFSPTDKSAMPKKTKSKKRTHGEPIPPSDPGQHK